MKKFEIFTDSSCDLTQEMLKKLDVRVVQLEVIIDDKPPVLNNDLDIKDFYQQLRDGANAKTAAVTPGYFEEEFRKSLEAGNDIIYIGFSSGLSVTYNNGAMALSELKEEFYDRKLISIDTLCASAGQGLLVYYAAMMRDNGASIDEIYEKIESIKQKIHHQVTVNDLFFLKRGGRISATSAIVGSVLKFKPIINVDTEGHLSTVGKVRGRKTSLNELLSRMKENAAIDEFGYVFISNSDCYEDACALADMVREEFNPKEIFISDIGAVIGAHTGPGTIALCYLGKTEKMS